MRRTPASRAPPAETTIAGRRSPAPHQEPERHRHVGLPGFPDPPPGEFNPTRSDTRDTTRATRPGRSPLGAANVPGATEAHDADDRTTDCLTPRVCWESYVPERSELNALRVSLLETANPPPPTGVPPTSGTAIIIAVMTLLMTHPFCHKITTISYGSAPPVCKAFSKTLTINLIFRLAISPVFMRAPLAYFLHRS